MTTPSLPFMNVLSKWMSLAATIFSAKANTVASSLLQDWLSCIQKDSSVSLWLGISKIDESLFLTRPNQSEWVWRERWGFPVINFLQEVFAAFSIRSFFGFFEELELNFPLAAVPNWNFSSVRNSNCPKRWNFLCLATLTNSLPNFSSSSNWHSNQAFNDALATEQRERNNKFWKRIWNILKSRGQLGRTAGKVKLSINERNSWKIKSLLYQGSGISGLELSEKLGYLLQSICIQELSLLNNLHFLNIWKLAHFWIIEFRLLVPYLPCAEGLTLDLFWKLFQMATLNAPSIILEHETRFLEFSEAWRAAVKFCTKAKP